MAFNHRKSVTYKLAQTARAYRTRAGLHLARIGLHAGQEAVLKSLADADGQTMGELAQSLGVQPPTVTKMVSRLSAQGLVRRQAGQNDGRLARVHLTEIGAGKVAEIDAIWKKVEKEALAGFDDKEKKRLRKLLREVEKNLTGDQSAEDGDGEDDAAPADVAIPAEID